jgi:hypothetical protein
MNRILFLLLPLLMILLSACPLEMDYLLDEPGKTPIDTRLLGTWERVPDEGNLELVKIKIGRGRAVNSYTIRILENSVFDPSLGEIDFTGYITQIEGKKFVYAVDEEKDDGKCTVYAYEIKNNTTLFLWDVSLPDEAKDNVISTKTFRAEIRKALQADNCLSEETHYKKQ